jgi:hypothetical protein
VQIGENHRAQLSFGAGAVIIGDVRGAALSVRARPCTR